MVAVWPEFPCPLGMKPCPLGMERGEISPKQLTIARKPVTIEAISICAKCNRVDLHRLFFHHFAREICTRACRCSKVAVALTLCRLTRRALAAPLPLSLCRRSPSPRGVPVVGRLRGRCCGGWQVAEAALDETLLGDGHRRRGGMTGPCCAAAIFANHVTQEVS